MELDWFWYDLEDVEKSKVHLLKIKMLFAQNY